MGLQFSHPDTLAGRLPVRGAIDVVSHVTTLGHGTAGVKSWAEADRWSVSAIVLWEIARLAQLGRIAVDLDDPLVIRVLARVQIWPLTREIARASTRLDVRGDPADELIAATSLVHQVPLVTRDRALLRSKVVPLAR